MYSLFIVILHRCLAQVYKICSCVHAYLKQESLYTQLTVFKGLAAVHTCTAVIVCSCLLPAAFSYPRWVEDLFNRLSAAVAPPSGLLRALHLVPG